MAMVMKEYRQVSQRYTELAAERHRRATLPSVAVARVLEALEANAVRIALEEARANPPALVDDLNTALHGIALDGIRQSPAFQALEEKMVQASVGHRWSGYCINALDPSTPVPADEARANPPDWEAAQ